MYEYRGYHIVNDGTFGMKFIKGIGRGHIPKDLMGSFSSAGTAQRAIDISLGKKESKNGEVVLSN